jgi:hypothetical protein
VRNPKPVRKVNSGLQGSKGALGDQIKLLQLGVGACLIAIVTVAAGGFALYRYFGTVDRKVSALQRSMQDVKAHLDRMDLTIGGTLSGSVGLLKEQAKIGQTLGRIESAVSPKSPNPIMTLTPSETAGLRAFFKLTKTNQPPRFKLQDKVPAADLKPMPENVYEKIAPRLKGTSFLIDQNGALVVTTGADNLVLLIVEPA